MASTRRQWWGRSVAVACVAPLLVAVGSTSASAATTDELHLGFDHDTWGFVEGQQFSNDGTKAADVSLVTVNDPVTMFRSALGGGLSLQLPWYSGTAGASYAALRVTPLGSDWLSPGTSDFSFGADLQINATSQGTDLDNGNNVVQRGLWDDPMQYKLEVDNNRPNCVFRGTEGRLSVRSSVTVEPKTWYQATCRRTAADKVSITVVELGSAAKPVVTTNVGPLGTLKAPAGTPLSVGAKLTRDGQILRSATDQFNGRVDNVFYAG